jgi:DNA-binding NarL/FixJ family response regulator
LDQRYRFVIADDHPLFRGALKHALSSFGDARIEEVGDFDAVKARIVADDDIDLLLLDLTMPGSSGLSGLVALRAMSSNFPIVVVSARDDAETVRRAIELGASGFISKSAGMDQMRKAVETVLAGGIALPDDLDLGEERDAAAIARPDHACRGPSQQADRL